MSNHPSGFLETPLTRLLATVFQAPPHSEARARALSHLIRHLQNSPRIRKVAHQDYLLALNQTWEWLSREIDRFQRNDNSVEDDLYAWINGYLNWRIRDLYSPSTTQLATVSLDATLSAAAETPETYLDLLSEAGFIEVQLSSLDQYIEALQQQANQEIAIQITAWITTDPDNILQNCCLRNHQHCNCQILSKRLLVQDPPDSFKKISQDLDIPYQTLVSHWKRSCLKLLKNTAKNFEYNN
jgi:hypothetical protein